MRPLSYWSDFPDDYRTEQVAQIVRWLAAGESGAVCGIGPTGRSNLLGYVASRNDVRQHHLPANGAPLCCIFFDIISLPFHNSQTFYRGMLDALTSQVPAQQPELAEELASLMAAPIDYNDAYGLFMRLQQAHEMVIRSSGITLAWLLNHFDTACEMLEPATLTSLRSLRDSFKGKLCFVVALSQPSDRIERRREIDFLYEIIARNTCWTGPMNERDARWLIDQMADRLNHPFSTVAIERMLEATGGQPTFLRSAISALTEESLTDASSLAEWVDHLLSRPEIAHACAEMDEALLQSEREQLKAIALGERKDWLNAQAVDFLEMSGLVVDRDVEAQSGKEVLSIFSPVYQAHLMRQSSEASNGITLHPHTRSVLRDGVPLNVELTNNEDRLLSYFLEHVGELCTKETLMAIIWPEEDLIQGGVRDDRLAQLVKRLREKIEVDPRKPKFILAVRGRGYRFIEGRN